MANVNTPSNIRGVALITVLLVVALAAILATEMTARLQVQLQRSANIQFNQQAYWYAMSAEALAKRVLQLDNEQDEDVTNLKQQWARGENTYPVDNGQITGAIYDLHACLNLNALRAQGAEAGDGSGEGQNKSPQRQALERLLVKLNIEGVGDFEAEYMADALTDWLDENDRLSSNGGAEDNDYAGRAFPHFAANHYLASVTELRVIEHFTPAIIAAIKPYVCVVPQSDRHQININTLTQEQAVLLSALLNISQDEANNIIRARDEEGFDEVEAFYNLPEVTQLNISEPLKQQFVVDSEYFTLKANAEFNSSYFNLTSTLQVIDNKTVNVVSRTIGRF
ncbi:general secretion pathway protein GspK [Thalassotalea euphylliae]|uniref:Type II secretion system protein K n=1 Tax=Thalassotalea euphylliae TaxID=1655234 RepID=A0A3E0TUW7_9GAMM|nr:type II secretion system minor pseudopilin GspK [Thalassotalea euphylliae]REL28461.1 general secretion pathway protein GspK [Thalassotalea euphylliae]